MGARGIVWVCLAASVACAAGPGGSGGPRTVVVLSFDDGRSDQFAAVDVLDEFGIRGTFFLVSGDLGRSDQFTLEQALALRAAGHEIGGHTLTHVRLTDLSDEEATLEVCTDREALADAGLGPLLSFAFPFSASDARTSAIVESCGYRWARSQGGIDRDDCEEDCVYAESFTPENAFELRAPTSVKTDWTLADLQGFVLRAEADGGVVVFTFHHVCDACDELYSITPALFREFVAWLAERHDRGTVVLPLAEALGGEKPDTTPPAVTLTSPAPGARLQGVVELAADASDDNGVAEVGFFVDGSRVGTASVPPYTVSWNAIPTKGSTAIITAHAVDLSGNEVVSGEVAVVIGDTSAPQVPDPADPAEPGQSDGAGEPEQDDPPARSPTGCGQANSADTRAAGLGVALVLLWSSRRRPSTSSVGSR